ncbi:PPE family protein [Saccharothrix hoggarensis]|uniref:PPE family protein n=1 Tax=Saccharothrix hoggarensis TaxID=913853 RepID=A0ABW3QLB7_9PSEU
MATWENGLRRRRTDGRIGNHNFDAQTHQQLYDKIHGGPGYPAAQTVDDAWARFLTVMKTAQVELERAIRESGAVWQGAAGERFAAGNTPLVQWAEDARAAAIVTRESLEAQALSYVDAKGKMPEPVEVTSTANDDFWGVPAGFTHLVGGQTDQDVEEARAQEAKRLAVAVMNGYRDRASAAVESLGEFVPPPSVTTQVVEPAAVERSEVVQTTRTTTPERTPTSDREAPGSVEPSGPVAPSGSVVPSGSVTPEDKDVGRTATSAVTTPSDSPSRPTPGPVTLPQQASAPLTSAAPVGIVPPGSRPTASSPSHPGRSSGKAASGGGAGRGAGAMKPFSPGLPGGGRAAPAPGPGGSTGIGNDAQVNRANAAATVRGSTGGPPLTAGLAGAPQSAQADDDVEHETAPYLQEVDDVWGVDAIPRVAPPVIGEDDR